MICLYKILVLHNDGVTWTPYSLQSPFIRLFVQLLMRTHIRETSKTALLALCVGNSPMTCEFPAQRASNAENASIWLRHYDKYRRTCELYSRVAQTSRLKPRRFSMLSEWNSTLRSDAEVVMTAGFWRPHQRPSVAYEESPEVERRHLFKLKNSNNNNVGLSMKSNNFEGE